MPRHGDPKERIFPDVSDGELDRLYDMLRGDRAREAHLHHLEHESLSLTLANGKTWKFYGSPVSCILAFLVLHLY